MVRFLIQQTLLATLFFALSSQIASAQTVTKSQYVDKYKDLAVSEMQRSGIPASITLAQGIVESNASNSKLAREGNNHFGIKCQTDWTGETILVEDDDYDSNGELIKSCFRKYKRPEESYLDHTDFLMNRQRYQQLFSLQSDDYKGWATGLKAAGYATNPKYADILIKTVEENNLAQYDAKGANNVTVVVADNGKKIRNPFSIKENEKGVFKNNSNKTIVAQSGETLLEIATKYNKPYAKMLEWNDLKPNDPLYANQFIYLESKCSRFKGNKKVHVVAEGENMYIISQLYGMKLSELYCRNSMKAPAEPAVNSRIVLSGVSKTPPKLQDAKAPKTTLPINGKDKVENKPTDPKTDPKGTKNTVKTNPQYAKVMDLLEELLKIKAPSTTKTDAKTGVSEASVETPKPSVPAVSTAPSVTKNDAPNVSNANVTPENAKAYTQPQPSPESSMTKPPVKSQPAITPEVPRNPNPAPIVVVTKAAATAGTHIVEPGETFFAIAKKYNTTVSNLKRINGFSDAENAISVGQVLKIR